jgi:enoyl-CoA hydratase/carnithine racemase
LVDMVIYSKEQAVATVSLSRAAAGNRINTQVVGELKDIQKKIVHDKDIRVVIISAEGEESFCAGTEPQEAYSSENRASFIELFSVAAAIAAIDRPVIAAINGAALGQGLELALACDLRVCSRDASFGLPQVTAGEMPWDGGTQRLSRLVGRGKALEMILLGESIDAQEALRIGLVHKVTPAGELSGIVQAMADKIADQSPISLTFAKEAVNKGMDLTLDQGLRLEADLYYLIHTTRDRSEGIKAFREKRRAQFEGR